LQEKLFLLNEVYTNGYIWNILDMISIFAVFCAISVIINKNPIISVLFLIGLFASISCYLIMLGLSFIGLSYLIVYIGAVSILFLFILMLINIRISELQSDTNNSIPLTIIIGISLSYSLFQLLPYDIAILSNFNNSLNYDLFGFSFEGLVRENSLQSSEDINSNFMTGVVMHACAALNTNSKDLFFTTSKIWDGNLAESNHITTIGNIMYTNYNIWLIIASFILLLAMVGAIIITIKQKNYQS